MNEALLAMYDRHRRIILAQLRGRVEAQDMEDVLQAVADAMLAKLALLRGMSDLRQAMYIRSIARNAAADYVRARVRSREHFADMADEDMERFTDSADGVETQVIRQDSLKAMQRAIRRLSAEKRDLLEMKYLQEMDDAQIAARLGIRRDNVRQRLSRVRREVRRMMEDMGYEKEV